MLDASAREDFIRSVIKGTTYPYTEHRIPKASGGERTLHAPVEDLLIVQRRVLGLLAGIATTVHPASYAYRTGYSVVDCASTHLRAQTLVRLDIADFSGSVRERHVYPVFREFESLAWTGLTVRTTPTNDRLSAYELTRLTTVSPPTSSAWVNRGTGARLVGSVSDPERFWMLQSRRNPYHGTREGFLAQGAPTSGLLSNLVMRDFDTAVFRLAESRGLRYTRYSDDLHFSGRRTVPEHVIDRLIADVQRELAALHMRLNVRKTKVSRSGSRRSVLGVLVDGPTPRLHRDYKRRITMHLRGARTFGIEDHAYHQAFRSVSALDSHVTGLLSFAHMVEPEWAAEQLSAWKVLRTSSTTSK